MRKILIALAASVAVASPALANEGRIEARGGVYFDGTTTEDAYGVAAGYDFDLGKTAFAGVEVSGDKIATTGTKVAFGCNRPPRHPHFGNRQAVRRGRLHLRTVRPVRRRRRIWAQASKPGSARASTARSNTATTSSTAASIDSDAVMVGLGTKF